MNRIPTKTSYSLDDVLLEPKRNDVQSRLDTDTSSLFLKNQLIKIPIVATNMDTITEEDMMIAMHKLGGVGILHRALSVEEGCRIIDYCRAMGVFPVASIGVGQEEFERAKKYIEAGATALLVDIAHGHSNRVLNQIKRLKMYAPTIPLIAGNVATYQGTLDLILAGADAVRVGIGGGARCKTRTVTGHGVGNLTAILDAGMARDHHYELTQQYIPLILDGGIKTSGDIVKALYFGADTVSIGGLLAGTDATPGDILIGPDNKKIKMFRGMASREAQNDFKGLKPGTAPEGFSESVPYKGPTENVINELVGGIRSGLTYSGAKDIHELRLKGEPVLLSQAARGESKL